MKEEKQQQPPYVAAAALSKLWRAVIEFSMLQKGDKILIGLSGGKDSMLLTVLMAELRKYLPFTIDLACYTLDGRFAPDFALEKLEDFCARYQLAHYSESIDMPALIAERGGSPCFSCAYFRRAAINRFAREHAFNKIAYAHHHDDAVETFLLNLLTSGQLRTFLPVTYLSRSQLTVLRPLLYYREQEIRDLVQNLDLTPLKNPCPYDGQTTRQSIKTTLQNLSSQYPEAYAHLAAAMRQAPQELWPRRLTQKENAAKFHAFRKQKNK